MIVPDSAFYADQGEMSIIGDKTMSISNYIQSDKEPLVLYKNNFFWGTFSFKHLDY